MNEFELIREFFDGDDGDAVLGIGDDAALVATTPGFYQAIAVDTLVAGRHFPVGTPAHAIGHRALAVNLSDLAAMGAVPRWMTLALTLPVAERDWLEAFSDGLKSLARRYGVQLIGGDTTQGPLVITVQVIGEVGDDALRRSGARPGDTVYVSRTLGDAAAGLSLIDSTNTDDDTQYLVDRFLYPTPRVTLGQRLRGQASAAIDVSDGLLADLGHICAQSGCAAEIDVAKLPLSDALVAAVDRDAALGFALQGGDDYELCFTAGEDSDARHWQECTPIGRIVSGEGVAVYDDGKPISMERHGFQHFG